MTLQDELLTAMKNRKYLLTTLCHRSIQSTTNGFVGFQITYGLWYKLVVFLIQKTNEETVLEEVLVEEFTEKDQAYGMLERVKAEY